ALESGLSESAAGELVRYAPNGAPAFVIRRFYDAHAKPAATYYAGLTFALDLPNVADASRVLAAMVRVAETFASTLGGQLVDDNRKPLTEPGLAIVRRSHEGIVQTMESHGIAAGSALARRLFS
ncbi:MAG TPA: cell division protein ZipA C-terminal FtsZ-binding domain-containing protein, partial [Usitatibacter sp.]